MTGFNQDLWAQMEALHGILRRNRPIYALLEALRELDLPGYYVGAGCVCQPVWNYLTGRDLMQGVSDADIVFYEGDDLSYEAEDAWIRALRAALPPLDIELDIKNQARVHLWFPSRFGREVRPYASAEDAITTWPSTASALGVRLEGDELRVFAPFGLNDLFGMVVRPNPDRESISEEIYMAKANKWKSKWPELRIVPW